MATITLTAEQKARELSNYQLVTAEIEGLTARLIRAAGHAEATAAIIEQLKGKIDYRVALMGCLGMVPAGACPAGPLAA
jgi:hypothetical protein